ncbi:unnamed protein product [Cuscuta campestris]|uniref:DUF7963 domain-containing protein n=2 Tax=Cuscuta sect. Cleistogrammica TaxID=1824901 RepID=A0A484L8X7_9ASTE|nr:hypothetical protein DM860_010878 [Cuscuta australis]VFQ72746.1 unnamed protein product [Cuscuta campestris]
MAEEDRVSKRYESLVGIRKKAVKGKGAWYWAHLEPILIRNPETNLPKSVKLKCNLCDAAFSASNPSRTATEHLKSGTCPNSTSVMRPISQLPPLSSPTPQNHRKRSSKQAPAAAMASSSSCPVVGFLDCPQPHTPNLVLSGGKEDLGALAMLEDSVKKLKSPKLSPGPSLKKDQIDSAFNLLSEWFYESCGSVSFSSLEHPKFKAFLNQVGLPPVSKKQFSGPILDSKFEQARMESEARIKDAPFFQIASDGWKKDSFGYGEDSVIKFTVNLPNGSRVFHKAVFKGGAVPSQYAEEVFWETVEGICGGGQSNNNGVTRCVGIVADKYKSKALRSLETNNNWMVNLPCLFQGFLSLIKDFSRELPLFRAVTDNCFRIANLFNRFRPHGVVDLNGLIRVPSSPHCNMCKNLGSFISMLEDVRGNARVLQMISLEDTFRAVCLENPVARDVADMVQDVGFWNQVEGVHSLVKIIREMAKDVEAERPLVGQCLPLWQALRSRIKDWSAKFNVGDEQVEKIVEGRFRKIYHPAWAAAFVLDPLYLMRDPSSGKYLPPFKCLSWEQEKDVEALVARLVPKEDGPAALTELARWRSEGLDPLYARAVQVKQRDPVTGRMRAANPQSSRVVWETCLNEFQPLGRVAGRLLFLHATSCGVRYNWSFMRSGCRHSRVGWDRAQRMIFIAAQAKLERGDLTSEEEKDAQVFCCCCTSEDGDHHELMDEVMCS